MSNIETFPLTPTQNGMLFHHLTDTRSGVDIEQIVCTLQEEIDAAALQSAWTKVLKTHPALGLRFRWEGVDNPVQEIDDSAFVTVRTEDWRHIPADRQITELQKFLDDDRQQGFDLRESPCMRVTLIRTDDKENKMIWTVHHIVCDGRSFPLVLGDLFSIYDGDNPAAQSKVSFADHVNAIQTLDLAAAESFWRKRLEGISSPTPLMAEAAGSVEGRGHVDRTLPPGLTGELQSFCQSIGISMNTAIQGAWALVLSRWSGESQVVFGATRAGRAGSLAGSDSIAGCFINTLPVRANPGSDDTSSRWLQALRDSEREVRPFDQSALMSVQGWSEAGAGQPLFESLIVYDHKSLDGQMKALGKAFNERSFALLERTNYPLTLYAYGESSLFLQLAFDEPRFEESGASLLLSGIENVLTAFARNPDAPVNAISPLSDEDTHKLLTGWNDTNVSYADDVCIHEAIEAQADQTPDAIAVVSRGKEFSYAELNSRANRLAHHLLSLGVGQDVPVGICTERGIGLLVSVLAIHKAGGCYLPLDPDYPRERLGYMLEDAGAPVLITETHLQHALPAYDGKVVTLEEADRLCAALPDRNPSGSAQSSDLAYLIYTSGSTGQPKGVMLEHRNALNFFTAMDEKIPLATKPPGTWLAVTSLSFDISVLELLWTLARGFRVVLHEDQQRAAARSVRRGENTDKSIGFSLMYFSSSDTAGKEKYRLLLEGAKFADLNGFEAVWTPERHFHEFGGLYPNPAVTSSALAMVTEKVHIRAGSVVNPLHHQARIAEEWSVVDNLSNGRVGIAFASGWQPRDFILRPEAFGDKAVMLEGIETIQKLWRGEEVQFDGPNGQSHPVRTLPRPVQPALPMWLTAAGSPDTFRNAGRLGAGVLTHLLGQSKEELTEKLKVYRDAWKEAGHAGEGHVTLMLHTFIGDNASEVRETVRGPMKQYLGSSLGLVKGFASSWTAFKKRSDGSTSTDVDLDSLTDEEMDGLLDYSFERYYESSALFGDIDNTLATVDELKGLGVNEIACLIDFGVEEDLVLEHLSYINRLRELALPLEAQTSEPEDESIPAQIEKYDVTHMQCTPSLAGMLLDDDGAAALGKLETMLLGGEALPPSLVQRLREKGVSRLLNMYGPTETTIWSAVHNVGDETGSIPIGKPIANNSVYILDRCGRLAPIGAAGELHIGGAGVARGYFKRPELTAERFIPDKFGDAGGRLYKTGDLARWREDGVLEFLGRIDHQVKIRGHRIELGEIESALTEHDAIREAVVIPREDSPGNVRLVAYLLATDLNEPPVERELRQFLREQLPEPMVPARFVTLEQFPQTPNRKIDRKALPVPESLDSRSDSRDANQPPAGSMEAGVAEIWREVLQLPEIGLDENFFDLGGHSLLAVKVHRLMNEKFERKLSITDLFRFPTVKSLADYLGDADGDGATLQGSHDRAAQRRQARANRRRPASRTRPTT